MAHYLTDEGLDELVKNTYEKDQEIKDYIGDKPEKVTLHTGEEVVTPNVIAYINAKLKDVESATRLEAAITKATDATPDLTAINDYYTQKGYTPTNGDIVLITNNGKEYLFVSNKWEEYGDQNMYVPKTMIATPNSNGIMASTDKAHLDSLWDRKIAGVGIKDDVSADDMKTGLGLAKVASTGAYGDLSGTPTLAKVATSGAYGDLSGTPTSLPANGGNAATVNNHTVAKDVPANADFTNTWRPIGSGATNAAAGNHNHDSVYLKSITKDMVTTALGYTPPTQDTDTKYSNGTGLNLTNTTFSVKYGTTAGTACQGNDSRLSDSRKANGGNADSAGKVNNKLTITTSTPSGATVAHEFDGSSAVSFTCSDTWRGIQNNLTSTSTTDSLSAAQGKALNDGKVSKTGDTMTGELTMKNAIRMSEGNTIYVRHIEGNGSPDGNLFFNFGTGGDIYFGQGYGGSPGDYKITNNGEHYTGSSESIRQGNAFMVPQYTTTNQQLHLQADGNLVLYRNNTAIWSTGTSSKRFKHNIEDMTEDRARQILQVRPVTFDYNDDQVCSTRKTDKAGVIAEEVAKVIDDVVVYEVLDDGSKVERTVEYGYFTPYLIKMVQMQQKEIDELKKIINEKLK